MPLNTPIKPTENESSPFAILKCDELHYGFVKFLSLSDIVSVAEASFHFNKFAEEFVFPRCTSLDLHDLPQKITLNQLNRIVHRVGRHLRTIVLNAERFSIETPVGWPLLKGVLSQCGNQLQDLTLLNFAANQRRGGRIPVDGDLLPPIKRLRLLNCDSDWTDEQPPFYDRLALDELELAGHWFFWPDANQCYQMLHTLSINRSTVRRPDLLTVLQRNAQTLRRLRLSHIYRLEEDDDQAGFWQALPSVVPHVTDLSVCARDIGFLTHGNFERLEIDQPLDTWWLDLLPRFPKLKRIAANYTANFTSPIQLNAIERDEQLLRRCVERLQRMASLQELHLTVDSEELRNAFKSIVGSLAPVDGHLHVFVYGRPEVLRRQSSGVDNQYVAKCQLRVAGEAVCQRSVLVERLSECRCEMVQDLSNILYDDDD